MFEVKKRKDERIYVRVSEEEKGELQKLAKENNTDMSKFIKKALNFYIEHLKATKKDV